MSTSSIDELLLGAKTTHHPQTPENQYNDEPEQIEEIEEVDFEKSEETYEEESTHHAQIEEPSSEESQAAEYDEYGNEKERMSKGMKDRLDRKEKQYQREVEQREREIENLRAQLAAQGASHQVQKAASDFEYDHNAEGDWQQQLASFVKQTVSSMSREQEAAQLRQQEHMQLQEFEFKFKQGMNKFDDFKEVITALPFEISNPMTLATRAMSDPAAFLYAAAKRNPGELERISKIRDPYAQMTEMGKLEERMKRNKPTTRAPRPLDRTNEDASLPAAKKKTQPTIEDLIAKADAKKMQRMKGRGRIR
jgi:hypothetical protein